MKDHTVNKLTVLPFSAYFSSRSVSFLMWGHQACMQYSNLGLTNDLYNCKIISSDLEVKILLIIPSILLAAFAAFTISHNKQKGQNKKF